MGDDKTKCQHNGMNPLNTVNMRGCEDGERGSNDRVVEQNERRENRH